MGFVTVQVQHSWSMQPNSANEEDSGEHHTNALNKNKDIPQESTSSIQVRLTDPESVRNFINAYNEAETLPKRQTMESEIRDILTRLSSLVFQSSVDDISRFDRFRNHAKPNASSIPFNPNLALNQSRRRFYASQARASLLMFSYCQTKNIREKALDILIEALDTNQFSQDSFEASELFQLINDTRISLEAAVDDSRAKTNIASGSDMATENSDVRVTVQEYIHRLLKCILLTLQRIEFISDMGVLNLSPQHASSLLLIREELTMFKTDDPYIVQLISTIHETIKHATLLKYNCDEISATNYIALSFLTDIIRLIPPPDIKDRTLAFIAILDDLNSKQEWHAGRKFLSLLGSAGMYHIQGLKVFLNVLKQVTNRMHWQWGYISLLQVASIALNSESSVIKKIAFEEGLLNYICIGDIATAVVPSASDYSWTFRAACAISLNHIYYFKKSTSMGLLAQAALTSRLSQERHPFIRDILQCPCQANIYPLSVNFKYIGRELAEDYTKSKKEIEIMKKVMKTTEAAENNIHLKKPHLILAEIDNDLKKLSVDPYHLNYKAEKKRNESKTFSGLNAQSQPNALPCAPYKPTYTCVTKTAIKNTHLTVQPTVGSANRRKLFDSSNRSLQAATPKPVKKLIVTQAPQIAYENNWGHLGVVTGKMKPILMPSTSKQ